MDDPTIGAHAGRRIDRAPVVVAEHPDGGSPAGSAELTPLERRLLGDLFAIV